jgi:hypothetical protein
MGLCTGMAIAVLVAAVLGCVLLLTSIIIYAIVRHECCKRKGNAKFQAFEDALPEGKTFSDEDWSSEVYPPAASCDTAI